MISTKSFDDLYPDEIPFTFETDGVTHYCKLSIVAGAASSSLYHLAELREGKWYHCGQLFRTAHFGWRYGGNRYEGMKDYFVRWIELWEEAEVPMLEY